MHRRVATFHCSIRSHYIVLSFDRGTVISTGFVAGLHLLYDSLLVIAEMVNLAAVWILSISYTIFAIFCQNEEKIGMRTNVKKYREQKDSTVYWQYFQSTQTIHSACATFSLLKLSDHQTSHFP